MTQTQREWHKWKKEYPKHYKSFMNFKANLSKKEVINSNKCISGILDVNGDIDEFELEKFLDNVSDPMPLDIFLRMNT